MSWCSGNAFDLNFIVAQFELLLEHQLSWLRYFMTLLVPSRKMLELSHIQVQQANFLFYMNIFI
jgi:hypothetical protein